MVFAFAFIIVVQKVPVKGTQNRFGSVPSAVIQFWGHQTRPSLTPEMPHTKKLPKNFMILSPRR